MNRILLLILALLGGCWTNLIHGQVLPQGQVNNPYGANIPVEPVNLQSPNAASLGLYGEIPVSYFTGVPNIDIPLYMFQEGDIKLPISLSYHASGVRLDQHPGWVGLGWNLMAGGVITRTVNDVPDEYNSPNLKYDRVAQNAGFYYTHKLLDVNNWDQIPYMQSIARDVDKVHKDTEPDEFSFNFLNYSGKFYLNSDGQWKVKCSQPVKVTLHETNPFLDVPFRVPGGSYNVGYGYPKTFGGFTITAEDGTEYVFGGDTVAIEYSIGFFEQNRDDWTAGAWYLTKIRKNGNEINFNYKRDNYVNQMYIAYTRNIFVQTISKDGLFGPQIDDCANWDFASSIERSYSGKLISPVYLSSIQGRNYKIEFGRSVSDELPYDPNIYHWQENEWRKSLPNNPYATFLPFLQEPDLTKGEFENLDYPACLDKLQWKKLDNIKVNYNGIAIKEFEFTYNNTYQNKSDERLMLLSLAEKGMNGVAKPPYKFSYNTSTSYPLPGYLSNRVDHWGFFTDKTASILYPENYTNAREPSDIESVALVGILNKITYPTGGVTEFEYEQHRYSKQLTEDRSAVEPLEGVFYKTAGGLRIRKITSYTPGKPNDKLEKEYLYLIGYDSKIDNKEQLPSSGVLGGQTKYYFIDYRTKAYNADLTLSRSIFSTQSVLPVSSNSQGSHVGYSQVIEKRSDGSYSKFHFSNFENGKLDEIISNERTLQPYSHNATPYKPYTSLEEERGKLQREESFTNNDVLVKSKVIEYVALNKASEYVKSLKAMLFAPCNSGAYIEEGVPYKIYTYSYLPIKETETIYDSGGKNPLQTVKRLTYNKSRLLASSSITDSKGQTILTEYKYPGDYSSAVNNCAQLRISCQQECKLGHNERSPELDACLRDCNQSWVSCESEYESRWANAAPIVYALKRMQDLHIVSPVIEETQWVSRFGTKSLVGSVLNLYKDFGTESGGIQLEQQQKVVLTAPVSQAYFVASTLNSHHEFIIDKRYSVEYNFIRYDSKGNLLEMIKEHAPAKSYLWGYKNTLPIAEVVNAKNTEVYYNGFEEEGVFDSNAKAGRHSHIGNYEFVPPATLTHVTGSKITYWSWSNVKGKWEFKEQPYNGGTVLCEGAKIDEVRIIPPGALMTTYTHDPFGMTSTTDPNSRTTYYEYDGLGRLKTVKDNDKNVLKGYEYYYKNQ